MKQQLSSTMAYIIATPDSVEPGCILWARIYENTKLVGEMLFEFGGINATNHYIITPGSELILYKKYLGDYRTLSPDTIYWPIPEQYNKYLNRKEGI